MSRSSGFAITLGILATLYLKGSELVSWVDSSVVPKYSFGVEIEIVGVPESFLRRCRLRLSFSGGSRERKAEAFRESVAQALRKGGEDACTGTKKRPEDYSKWYITTDSSLREEHRSEGI